MLAANNYLNSECRCGRFLAISWSRLNNYYGGLIMPKQDPFTQRWQQRARTLRAVAGLAPRWLRLAGVLALVLSIGIPSRAAVAQPDPNVTVHGYMKLLSPKRIEMCFGESASITVKIVRDLKGPLTDLFGAVTGDLVVSVDQTNIKVGATVRGEKLVTVPDPTAYTSMANVPPGTATFNIRAGKIPGSTNVYITAVLSRLPNETLDGPMGTNIVDATVSVTVQKCKYKVKASSQWHFPRGGGNFVVSTKEAVLSADADGHYTGSASVTWVASVMAMGACLVPLDLAPSQVNMAADLDDNGQVTVKLTYQPVSFYYTKVCSNGSETGGPGTFTPAPLSVTVAASGGTSTQLQVLESPGYFGVLATDAYSSAAITVVREVDSSAVAFNTGNLNTMRWNDFRQLALSQ